MERIAKIFTEPEIKILDEKKRIILHPISAEVKDRMGDIVRLDGMDAKNFKKKPTVFYGHLYGGLDPLPVAGKNLGFKRMGKKMYAKTQMLNPETDKLSGKLADLVNDLWELNKMKLLGWSIGFIPTETEDLKDKEDRITGQDFKKWELLEYSNVLLPANQEAVNDAIKNGVVSKSFADIAQQKNFDYQNFYDNSLRLKDELPEEIAEEKPYPNEHACRLNDPGKYDKFRRGKREHEGKAYLIIFGKLKGKDKWEEQAYRYDKDTWTASEARKHCKDHDGTFEAAGEEECLDCNESQIQGVMPDLINALQRVIEALQQTQETIANFVRNLTGGKSHE